VNMFLVWAIQDCKETKVARPEIYMVIPDNNDKHAHCRTCRWDQSTEGLLHGSAWIGYVLLMFPPV
jgi:hypothetical protein